MHCTAMTVDFDWLLAVAGMVYQHRSEQVLTFVANFEEIWFLFDTTALRVKLF